MPLRQTIGTSLALFMASSGAMAETPDEGTAHHPTASQKATPEKSTSGTAPNLGGFHWPEKLALPTSFLFTYRETSIAAG